MGEEPSSSFQEAQEALCLAVPLLSPLGGAGCTANWDRAQKTQLEPYSNLEAVNGEKSKVTASHLLGSGSFPKGREWKELSRT